MASANQAMARKRPLFARMQRSPRVKRCEEYRKTFSGPSVRRQSPRKSAAPQSATSAQQDHRDVEPRVRPVHLLGESSHLQERDGQEEHEERRDQTGTAAVIFARRGEQEEAEEEQESRGRTGVERGDLPGRRGREEGRPANADERLEREYRPQRGEPEAQPPGERVRVRSGRRPALLPEIAAEKDRRRQEIAGEPDPEGCAADREAIPMQEGHDQLQRGESGARKDEDPHRLPPLRAERQDQHRRERHVERTDQRRHDLGLDRPGEVGRGLGGAQADAQCRRRWRRTVRRRTRAAAASRWGCLSKCSDSTPTVLSADVPSPETPSKSRPAARRSRTRSSLKGCRGRSSPDAGAIPPK